MKNSLKNILLQKYEDQKLASLYLINYESHSFNIETWVKEFALGLTKIDDHPDILKITKAANETQYKVDSKGIEEFLTFINYRPLELKKKFIFIFDAHDLSPILSNKLLKVFEELSAQFCLFLLVPDNAFMLPTVLSRAIKLKASTLLDQKFSSQTISPHFDSIKTPQDLMAFLKEYKDPQDNGSTNGGAQIEKKFIEQTIDRILSQTKNHPSDYHELDSLLKALAEYETYTNFNNSKLSRLARFFP